MIKLVRRGWNYVVAMLTGRFNEAADPKVQLEQAIIEAQEQHRKLKENAANVIANQKQTEMRLNRAMEEMEKIAKSARQAVLMAEDAQKKGDDKKMEEYTAAAESFANRLIAVEHEVDNLKALSLQQAQSTDQAKAAVQQNSTNLQKRLSERQKLLSQLDQAKMQEQMNNAMTALNESVGQNVPSFDEVRDKIESRYAKAKGAQELQGESVEGRMLEIEQAALNTEAQARLSKIRTELGLDHVSAEAESNPLSEAPDTETQTEPATGTETSGNA